MFIIIFWTISPAVRTNAVYAPDQTGLNPGYWVPMWVGNTQPASGPDTGDADGNAIADWYDQFQAAVGAGYLTWWGGGSFYVDGVAQTFAAQWCVTASQWGSPQDFDGDGIPDSVDPYPSDPSNNSYDWPGGSVWYNGGVYMLRARCFTGTTADVNGNGVPDCMGPSLNAPGWYLWYGGTYMIDGQDSTFQAMSFYGSDSGDIDGDGIPDGIDPYPNDAWNNSAHWWAGGDFYINGIFTHMDAGYYFGPVSPDSDGDGIPDCIDPWPTDFNNNTAWWQGGTFL